MQRSWALALVLLGCHFGRPPARSPEASAAREARAGGALLGVGAVRVPAVEPALQDDLVAAMGAALARRGRLGAGPAVDITVLVADEVVLGAATTGRQVHLAHLTVVFEVPGTRPRRLELSGDRSYEVRSGASLEASAARATAYGTLAVELCEDASDWLLYGPTPENRAR